jgi:lactoylglutathione lyase
MCPAECSTHNATMPSVARSSGENPGVARSFEDNSLLPTQSILFSMKKLLACCVLALSFFLAAPRAARAQGPVGLNHIALYVVDLQKSADFYKNALLLPELAEPFKDGKHVWLRIGPHSQLHIIQGNKVQEHDINTHLAFSVKDLPKFMAHLDKLGVHYGSWKSEPGKTTPRPDGVQQIYLQDPDGFWLEVNNDKF